jgi:adenylate/nucleoside-diphosphate kinase
MELSLQDAVAVSESKLEVQGYCPVTYVTVTERGDYKDYEPFVKGSKKFLVLFKSKYFAMSSEENKQEFLCQPGKYSQVSLPAKMPPAKVDLNVDSLPLFGYMEQTVAKILATSFEALINFKPKFPHKTSKESALKYLAIYLKANNPNSSEFLRNKYADKLEKFKQVCENTQWILELCRYYQHDLDNITQQADFVQSIEEFDKSDKLDLRTFIQ